MRGRLAESRCSGQFLCLARGPFLRPGLRFMQRRAQRRSREERRNPEPRAARSCARAWRGLRAPDLDRREHDATFVVGRDLDRDQDWVVRRFGLTGGGAATVLSVIAVGGYAAPESNRSSRSRPILVQSTRDVTGYNGNTTAPPAMPQWRGRLAAPELGDSSPNWLWHL